MNKNLRITLFFSLAFIFFISFMFTGNGWLIFLAVMSIIMLISSNIYYHNNLIKKINNYFKDFIQTSNFTLENSYLGEDGISGISIDEERNRLGLIKRSDLNSSFEIMEIDFSEIIESSIKENGETVTKTSRGSQIGGALVGGALAGGLGSVVGALGAKQTSSETVKKITLEIVINDLKNPIHEIVYFISPTPLNKSDQMYKSIFDKANKWHKTIAVILKRNEFNSKTI